MERCKTCKHWRRKDAANLTFAMIGFREREGACSIILCSDSCQTLARTQFQSITDHLVTHEEFGCVHHEPKTS
jgi:hypothetical protein